MLEQVNNNVTPSFEWMWYLTVHVEGRTLIDGEYENFYLPGCYFVQLGQNCSEPPTFQNNKRTPFSEWKRGDIGSMFPQNIDNSSTKLHDITSIFIDKEYTNFILVAPFFVCALMFTLNTNWNILKPSEKEIKQMAQ